MCQPIKAPDDPSMVFLQKAVEVFEIWKGSHSSGLTSETFLASIQSMKAFIMCATHLLESHGFSYVLSGKFLSDPIEGRFGWYRQMNGGNFFMSVTQLLQSEKKIRVLSKLQQQQLLAASNLSVEPAPPLPFSPPMVAIEDDTSWLIHEMEDVSLDELSYSDANISYFVGGYIGRSISRQNRCVHCKEILVGDNVVNSEDDFSDMSQEFRLLFELADRGGLSAPTEFCFTATSFSVVHYNFLISDDLRRKTFLTSVNPRKLFVNALLEKSHATSCLTSPTCQSGHACFHKILELSFNCFAKNELKRLNTVRQASEPASASRKIRKLNSQN